MQIEIKYYQKELKKKKKKKAVSHLLPYAQIRFF